MAVTTADRKWTYDDLVRLPYDGKRHEIIDGQHFVMSSPYPIHQAVLGRLYLAIGNFLTARPEAGQVFVGPLDVVLTMFDVVAPDLLVVASGQADILTDRHVRGAPALVVEILSTSTRRRDERVKRALYEREGVRDVRDPGGEQRDADDEGERRSDAREQRVVERRRRPFRDATQ